MAKSFFLTSWASVASLVVVYVLVGLARDIRAWIVARRTQRTLSLLAIVLMESDYEAEAVHAQVGKLPVGALLDVLQDLAMDFEGQVTDRLRQIASARGLDRRIRRRAKSSRWRHRVQAAQLQHLVEDSNFDWQGLVNDKHPLVRARAIEGLSRPQTIKIVDPLLLTLRDPDAAVRWATQQSLLALGSELVPHLIRLLRSGQRCEEDLVVAVLELAVNLPDPRLAPALIALTNGDSVSVRRLAADALSQTAADGVEVTMLHLLNDREDLVRVAAVNGLALLNAESAVGVIGKCLSDRSWNVRRSAGLALDQLGPSGRLLLRCHLHDEDPFARDMARRVLDARAVQKAMSSMPLVEVG